VSDPATANARPSVAPRLHPADLIHVGLSGLRTRKVRALLSALGVAIGIASLVAVLGISHSSRADLIAKLDKLGTNLLTVTPGQTIFGRPAELPATASKMIERVAAVQGASSVEAISGVPVLATPYISPLNTNGITLEAADPTLLNAVAGSVAQGRFFDIAGSRYPVVVLGADTAQLLGITTIGRGVRVYIGGHWFSVLGILQPLPLAPELDASALIGLPIAKTLFKASGHATTIYVRSDPSNINAVGPLLPATADPENPENVQVARPSDALAARAAAKSAFTSLFLGLGAVALLVGGIGIANIMVISVLERRSEIGLRRALGATKRHIAIQFLTESVLLAAAGGFAGAALGALATVGYASSRGWMVSLPAYSLFGGFGAAIAIGALAGLYPAGRAARLSPTDALRSA
jgi:putative ABC transport system permease protein